MKNCSADCKQQATIANENALFLFPSDVVEGTVRISNAKCCRNRVVSLLGRKHGKVKRWSLCFAHTKTFTFRFHFFLCRNKKEQKRKHRLELFLTDNINEIHSSCLHHNRKLCCVYKNIHQHQQQRQHEVLLPELIQSPSQWSVASSPTYAPSIPTNDHDFFDERSISERSDAR